MRTGATLVALVFAAGALTACGGAHTVSVSAVERAFARHGQPFTSKLVPDPYLARQQLFPAGSSAAVKDAERHLRAALGATNPSTFSMLEVWVFDSAADAERAQRLIPMLADRPGKRVIRGNSVSETPFVVRRWNVVVLGSLGRRAAVRAALADLG